MNKIWEGIGKKAKADDAAVVVETNAAIDIEDIFGEVGATSATNAEDTNIF